MERVVQTPRRAFLAGSWQATTHTFPVFNPATGDIVAQVADCGPTEAKQAVDVAVSLFDAWKNRTAYERADILQRWYHLILTHEEELGRLMTSEMGKPIREAYGRSEEHTS